MVRRLQRLDRNLHFFKVLLLRWSLGQHSLALLGSWGTAYFRTTFLFYGVLGLRLNLGMPFFGFSMFSFNFFSNLSLDLFLSLLDIMLLFGFSIFSFYFFPNLGFNLGFSLPCLTISELCFLIFNCLIPIQYFNFLFDFVFDNSFLIIFLNSRP